MKARYSNLLSRILLKRDFERQFYIPPEPKFLERKFLRALEKNILRTTSLDFEIRKPIFIVGLPRSGTSLLYDTLCAHPQAIYVNNITNRYFDTPLAIEWIRKKLGLGVEGERFFKDSVIVNLTSPGEPFGYWGKWFKRDVESLTWKSKTLRELGPNAREEICFDLRKIAAVFGKKDPRFVCKFAIMQPEIELIQEIFPDSKFINIVRDGREVAHSLLKLRARSNEQLRRIKHPSITSVVPYPRIPELAGLVDRYGPDSIRCTAEVWKHTLRYLEELKPRLSSYYELRYEDLMANPQPELARLLAFCELSTPANREFTDIVGTFGKIRHRNDYAQGGVVEEHCGETLRKYSYL